MTLRIRPEFQRFIDDQLKDGRYGSAEEVVEAGLASLQQQVQSGEFGEGELDDLLAEGEADIASGKVCTGDEVFREIGRLSEDRKQGKIS